MVFAKPPVDPEPVTKEELREAIQQIETSAWGAVFMATALVMVGFTITWAALTLRAIRELATVLVEAAN